MLRLTDRETMRARLERTVGNPVAKSSIDMAVWDALGKTLDLPVTELLGGYTDRMRVCHMLGFDEPAAMVAELQDDVTTSYEPDEPPEIETGMIPPEVSRARIGAGQPDQHLPA